MSVTDQPSETTLDTGDERDRESGRRGRRSLNPSALRDGIPPTGLREYWYPALPASKVGRRKPAGLMLLGTTLAFFRGEDGRIAAVSDVCPHRGASLSRGSCHFSGTLTCPYHGWTFDQDGQCVAVLGEGPESRIPGMRDATVRRYPTRTLKGMVWVWMGERSPAPIEHDVPPQFFDDEALIQHSITEWQCNWRPAMENLLDAHVFYVHRNSLQLLLLPAKNFMTMSRMGPRRPKPHVANGRGLMYRPGDLAFLSAFIDSEDGANGSGASGGDARTDEEAKDAKDANAGAQWPPKDGYQERYPGLGGQAWPKHASRLQWHRVVGAVRDLVSAVKKTERQPMITDPEWHDAHLPSTYQVDYQTHIYTRTTVPIDAERSRIFYFHTTRPLTPRRRLRDRLFFELYQNWQMNYNFSGQDADVVEYQHYDQPEKFSATDVFPLTLRRFILEHGRDFQDVPAGGEGSRP
jgi:phenylpropionate dioxygenase-like ring-hydroxylating dioxygenase large terminal subunit